MKRYCKHCVHLDVSQSGWYICKSPVNVEIDDANDGSWLNPPGKIVRYVMQPNQLNAHNDCKLFRPKRVGE